MIVRLIDQWTQEDTIGKAMRQNIKNYQEARPSHLPSNFHLLRRHPLLCGLLSFSIRDQMQKAGVMFANVWGSIIYSGHLYNAVRQENYCNCIWREMEELLGFHTPEQFFAGEAPNHASAYTKQFEICVGARISNTGPRRSGLSSSGRRNLDLVRVWCPEDLRIAPLR